ncbi:hypothetical protein NIES4074_40970 [Cylindrospermum sp. NIES-4074]|nr:hypothetical protein NIES4074_40970 [Cylindrospermum sp. NIES-4074]
MANITVSDITLLQEIEFPELSDLELETVMGGKITYTYNDGTTTITATGKDARALAGI